MFDNNDIKQLKFKDVKPLREKLHKEQKYICPICKEVIPLENIALDHQHKLFKNQDLITNDNGLVRGVICSACNSTEGKIFNAHIRYGIHKKSISFSDWLRSLADYLEKEKLPFIHPTEKPKSPKISKRNYNILKKRYEESGKKAKFPEYPKSGRLNKKLKKLFEEFDISCFN